MKNRLNLKENRLNSKKHLIPSKPFQSKWSEREDLNLNTSPVKTGDIPTKEPVGQDRLSFLLPVGKRLRTSKNANESTDIQSSSTISSTKYNDIALNEIMLSWPHLSPSVKEKIINIVQSSGKNKDK
jgi:hypothetical protein